MRRFVMSLPQVFPRSQRGALIACWSPRSHNKDLITIRYSLPPCRIGSRIMTPINIAIALDHHPKCLIFLTVGKLTCCQGYRLSKITRWQADCHKQTMPRHRLYAEIQHLSGGQKTFVRSVRSSRPIPLPNRPDRAKPPLYGRSD